MSPLSTLAVAVVAFAVPLVTESAPLTLSADERRVIALTNAERRAADLGELKPNARLFAAARGHSANMAAQKTMAHELDGKNFDVRVTAAGYKYRATAENVAAGQDTPAEAVEAWMKSEGHKANLLGDYTEIGVAVAKGEDGRLYWTQVFGTPAE